MIHKATHVRKKHHWSDLDGYQRSTCKDCNAIKYWDNTIQRIVYFDSFGNGPFYWAPKCNLILATDKHD
jgi:hypothetical protein